MSSQALISTTIFDINIVEVKRAVGLQAVSEIRHATLAAPAANTCYVQFTYKRQGALSSCCNPAVRRLLESPVGG